MCVCVCFNPKCLHWLSLTMTTNITLEQQHRQVTCSSPAHLTCHVVSYQCCEVVTLLISDMGCFVSNTLDLVLCVSVIVSP